MTQGFGPVRPGQIPRRVCRDRASPRRHGLRHLQPPIRNAHWAKDIPKAELHSPDHQSARTSPNLSSSAAGSTRPPILPVPTPGR